MNAKKIVALLLALVMVLSLAACGTGSSTGDAANAPKVEENKNNTQKADTGAEKTALEGEITFWHCFTQGARMEAIDAAAAAFMEANPGVKINIETMSWGDFNTKWNAGLTTGDLPECCSCGYASLYQWYFRHRRIQKQRDSSDVCGRRSCDCGCHQRR